MTVSPLSYQKEVLHFNIILFNISTFSPNSDYHNAKKLLVISVMQRNTMN